MELCKDYHFLLIQALQQRPYLFNQSKFRYYDGFYDGDCTMHLGLTDYKSYVGSNLGREWKKFYEEGEKIGNVNVFFADPLGNQCVVVLKDGYHVFVNRSYQVAEGEGKLTCLGGHPEPSVYFNPLFFYSQSLNIQSYEDGMKITEEALVNELFDSMDREVKEESNIPLEFIKDTRMIGVIGY